MRQIPPDSQKSIEPIPQVEAYFNNFSEQIQLILWDLRQMVMQESPEITEHWKYKAPCYMYKGFCLYIYADKKRVPYLAFVNGNLMKDEYGLFFKDENKQIRKIFISELTAELKAILTSYIQEALVINEALKEKIRLPGH